MYFFGHLHRRLSRCFNDVKLNSSDNIGWIKKVGVLNLSSYFPENNRRLIKLLSAHPSSLFEVRGWTAEILEAPEPLSKGVGKGLNLGLHIVSLVWDIYKRGGNIENKTRYCGQMCRARLSKALKAYFSVKRKSPLKLASKFC